LRSAFWFSGNVLFAGNWRIFGKTESKEFCICFNSTQ
jgi:hypothetical protein